MNQSKQFMMIGSILYLVGSAIFLAQAIAAKDFWARTGSVAFLVSSFFFVGSVLRDHR
ncbi:MAG: hypothetical protein ACKVHU_01680 [Acidimicrobiales bacterium]|jgi:hypothetical protein